MSTVPPSDRWRPGERLAVRGRRWKIAESTAWPDCMSLRLLPIDEEEPGSATILIPFDRPSSIAQPRKARIVSTRRWLHVVRRIGSDLHPFGGLRAAARAAIDLLPYQLEPALAVLRYGATRVVIADAVGLGKTIQAGLVLLELSAARSAFRAIVLLPAGLRDQWAGELAARFRIAPIEADAAWLRAAGADVPPDINPWSLPGVYLASLDFVKRPEVLRALTDLAWDLLIVDEAHLATLGTERRLAADAVARRARRVLLLTATPHSGDAGEFDALFRLGAVDSATEPRPVTFARTRADTGNAAPRRSVLLFVRPTRAELRMHELLHAYTSAVWNEAHARGDAAARLVTIILRKRALSSAGALVSSVQRRLQLLAADESSDVAQPLLPFMEEDPLEDEPAAAALGAPGLRDPRRERRWLAAILEAARHGSKNESKSRVLLRLLRRIREPVIIFTEYRDTLVRLERAAAATGTITGVLHGGLTLSERSAVQRTFNDGGITLFATDAAAEGLNLHAHCRTLIHYELPWSTARIEQRAGRVDRHGQTRRVHEIALVATDTAERLVVAPLVARATRVRASTQRTDGVVTLLTDSRVAERVMQGSAHVDIPPATYRSPPAQRDIVGLREEAVHEASRLARVRLWLASASTPGDPPVVASSRRASRTPWSIALVYRLALCDDDHEVHSEAIVLRASLSNRPSTLDRELLRDLVQAVENPRSIVARTAGIVGTAARERVLQLWRNHSSRVRLRQHAMQRVFQSDPQTPLQTGLFDRRALREHARQARALAAMLGDLDTREGVQPIESLSLRVELAGALVTPETRSTTTNWSQLMSSSPLSPR